LIAALVALTVAPAALGQGRTVKRSRQSGSSGMSWSTHGFTWFARPSAAPGMRSPSIDGTLCACTRGSAAATPEATGLDITYKDNGGSAHIWGGPGDQLQPAVSDGLIAGLDRGQVAVFDPGKQAAVVVSDPAAEVLAPAFDGDVVVWQDHRNESWDIYGRRFDRTSGQPTGDVFVVCAAAGDQVNPAVNGDRVVWQDGRETRDDIYSLDLGTMQESPVCTAPGDQRDPDVFGQVAVWQDARSGQWDIWSYDFGTTAEKAICLERGRQIRPAVSADLVVWEDYMPLWVDDNKHPRPYRWAAPLISTFSLAADESLEQVWWQRESVKQTRPDVSASTMVWEDGEGATATRNTRIFCAEEKNVWAYSYDLSPDAWMVNDRTLTFTFDVLVCPHPPVAEVGFSLDPDAWDYEWQPYAHEVSVELPAGDGRKQYMVSLRDSAGDSPGGSGADIILDTHGPFCWTPFPLSVRSGAVGILAYKVTDRLSPEVRAAVTITESDGRVVRTLPPRRVRTGRMLQRRLDCDLIPGTYRVEVTATDLAGNPQARIGTTTLTVR
jgi:beta propeller repeat protein